MLSRVFEIKWLKLTENLLFLFGLGSWSDVVDMLSYQFQCHQCCFQLQLASISVGKIVPTPRGGVANRVVPEIYGDWIAPRVQVLVLPGNVIFTAHQRNVFWTKCLPCFRLRCQMFCLNETVRVFALLSIVLIPKLSQAVVCIGSGKWLGIIQPTIQYLKQWWHNFVTHICVIMLHSLNLSNHQ